MNLVVEALPSQLEVLNQLPHSENIIQSGAYGSGKTRTGLMAGVILNHYYPGNSGLIVRKHFSSLRSSTLWTLLYGNNPFPVLPRQWIIDHNKSDHRIIMRSTDPKRPSMIYYTGIDDPVKLRSFADIGWVFYDEIIESQEAEIIELEGRLRNPACPFNRLFGATNPGDPGHFLYKRFFEAGKPKKDKIDYCVTSNTLENRFLPAQYIERLKRFKGKFYDRFVLGLWIALEGIIYDMFEPQKSIIPQIKIPDDWPRYIAIDWGFQNPMVIQWWTKAKNSQVFTTISGTGVLQNVLIPEGAVILYREIYQSHLSIPKAAKMVLSIMESNREPQPEFIVCDHDPGDADLFETETGFWLMNANKGPGSVKSGIMEVAEYMACDTVVLDSEPRPKLFITENCRNNEPDEYLQESKKPMSTAEELQTYKWEKDRLGSYDRDRPEKKNDHGMDCLRYFITSLSEYECVVRVTS